MSYIGIPCVIVFTLMASLCEYGSAILCYDCNSAYDPRCGAAFDPYSLGVVNCSLREPLEHLPDLRPSICRTIKMEIYGKSRVVRSCGYIPDPKVNDRSCQRHSSSDHLHVTHCACTEDLCNGSQSSFYKYSAILLSVTTLMSMSI